MTSDTLTPNYTSQRRKSSIVAATFNLTATILGGGVLSLPLAFEKCGVMLGSLLMIVSMAITERALFLLCICARISGATTYGEVGKAAFGTKGEYGISMVLFVYLMFVTVAFMILVQDIWTSIVSMVARKDLDDVNQDWVLLVVLILMSPCFIQRSLHALRFNCYIGFASIPILLLALWHDVATEPIEMEPLQWTNSFNDVLFAFPIINLSFLCVFNVLPVQAALIRPSRKRMQLVIDGAIGFAFIIMIPFGICGYMYSGKNTDGNILNNIPAPSDWMAGGIGTQLFFLGRFGCGVTLTLAMPLMLLPCRDTLLELLDVALFGPHIVEPRGEKLPLLSRATSTMSERSVQDPIIVTKRNERRLNENSWVRYLLTFLILDVCYMVAIHAPGVAVVWSLVGSSMAFLIAFILPSACYIKIQQDSHFPNDESTAWLWFAQGLFVLAVIAVVACTSQSIIRLL
mmetsp:Transcript_8737/g.20914  ORF Transcript_8737/g.20914 Transcript_8737/m.20914 type:complete len:459 (+) Transcript_8737:118-1494(+)|eukprot:CAMPEP_0113626654 /NCGR_PEP_ID=MMETSP0017_2-20120614/13788_1 /TAXON_ID=2856 /ORGANISM="Cylindrotheca closterium" /LENGTH=458 /DNA_ID=CAMNT_0000536849 /DNA_START=27 /DNA_END=1403 /DNA_ORIENTATION=- /assembly_acc=CAM_ASM_000147